MHVFTFPKSERLLKRWEFQNVYINGKKLQGNYITVFVLSNQPKRKLGISISKKTGNAVIRNRAKRLIREVYRLNKHKLIDNTHFVISAKPEIKGIKYRDLEKDFLGLSSLCKQES